MITCVIARAHRVQQIRSLERHCAGKDKETECVETIAGVSHFAQAINATPSHFLQLRQGEMATSHFLKYYWVIII